jgi:integrase/recombinase XerD
LDQSLDFFQYSTVFMFFSLIRKPLFKKFGKQYKSHVKRPDAPLTFSAKGGGFNAQTIINLFQNLYEKAGITGASSHSGRRQFVTELADKGINARVIQALARHKHLNTTMRYIDINENKMRAAIEIIDN